VRGVRRALLVFLDGVGIGAPDARTNAFLRAHLPTLDRLLGGRPTLAAPGPRRHAAATPLDACLGMPGLPQSGTGQAALLTGVNAARRFGRHFGPWTPVSLRPGVAGGSLLAVARRAGRAVAFANAYPEELLAAADRPKPPMPLRAATVIAARGAGALMRSTPELVNGQAIASEITNGGWREHLRRRAVPDIDPGTAGRNLAAIAASHELTLFAHYATDTAGHAGDMARAVSALERVDGFLEGLVAALAEDTLVIIASDHGNIEDIDAGHTRNPALGVVIGPAARVLAARMSAITDVAPTLLNALGVDPGPPEDPGGMHARRMTC